MLLKAAKCFYIASSKAELTSLPAREAAKPRPSWTLDTDNYKTWAGRKTERLKTKDLDGDRESPQSYRCTSRQPVTFLLSSIKKTNHFPNKTKQKQLPEQESRCPSHLLSSLAWQKPPWPEGSTRRTLEFLATCGDGVNKSCWTEKTWPVRVWGGKGPAWHAASHHVLCLGSFWHTKVAGEAEKVKRPAFAFHTVHYILVLKK